MSSINMAKIIMGRHGPKSQQSTPHRNSAAAFNKWVRQVQKRLGAIFNLDSSKNYFMGVMERSKALPHFRGHTLPQETCAVFAVRCPDWWIDGKLRIYSVYGVIFYIVQTERAFQSVQAVLKSKSGKLAFTRLERINNDAQLLHTQVLRTVTTTVASGISGFGKTLQWSGQSIEFLGTSIIKTVA